uniref:TIR domain-containing protein n=1 Tax=Candidatus Kentrum sp. LFY TaxID=2126342 RepID=A0A450ULV8_9GAMM|nr:MAG: TIR domain-containing protein [Candidatus Kentron sp. LFY]
MKMKVFVSHAAADETLASALVDFLMTSLSLDDENIRCTSVPGHKLPVGSESATIIREELGESAVVIGLITKNAISSGWVLFELGATWGAKKKLKPLVSGEIGFAELPGPLSGHHVAKLSSKSDLSQFVDEVADIITTKARTRPKIDAAIDKLIRAHQEHVKIADQKSKSTAIKPKEPVIGGIPYSELVDILRSEKIVVPAELTEEKKDVRLSLFDFFIKTHHLLVDGIRSNEPSGSQGAFVYREVALRLMPYNLVEFEKLPAAQASYFKRLVVSNEGNKFLAHYKRSKAKERIEP